MNEKDLETKCVRKRFSHMSVRTVFRVIENIQSLRNTPYLFNLNGEWFGVVRDDKKRGKMVQN